MLFYVCANVETKMTLVQISQPQALTHYNVEIFPFLSSPKLPQVQSETCPPELPKNERI